MTAQELKDKLSEKDIRSLLNEMEANIYYEDDDVWISDTICHHGKKPKLYYFKDSMSFHCYTECGQLDILGVVMGYKGYSNEELYKAINWICIKLNIDNCEYGFGNEQQISDWDFIRRYKKSSRKPLVNKPLIPYSKDILKIFQRWFSEEWINEGISIETMDKYNIMYSPWQQKIIIPHFNITNELIGVRGRSMLEEDIELFGKYTPFKVGRHFYNHSLGQNLYGLNHNMRAIQRKRKIMLVESEKAVMQTDTMFGDDNFTVGLCGCNLSDYQKSLILMLGVREVIVALDKQYENLESEECKKWAKHINEKIIMPLAPYLTISVIWDVSNDLNYKDSPTDKGKETLLKLMDSKIYVGTVE